MVRVTVNRMVTTDRLQNPIVRPFHISLGFASLLFRSAILTRTETVLTTTLTG